MRHHRQVLLAIVLAALLAAGAPPGAVREGNAQPAPAQGRVTAAYTLPDISLAGLQNSLIPGSLANDRGLLLGGIGSDLWHGPTDAPNEFWMVTDRGPNGQIRVDGQNRRTFPIPDFTPMILRVRLEAGTVTVVQAIPVVGVTGRPVTGLSNIDGYDETPYDYAARTRLAYNASGLDTEGIVRTTAGEFWLADEYSPSLLRVNQGGRVIARYVPRGVVPASGDYPVYPALPAIYGTRKQNRGFEGIALSPDERTLFLVLQSPLSNPTRAIGDASRNTRILAFDIATGTVAAEYVYRFQPAAEFGAMNTPDEMKLSAVVALSGTTLLILERTDPIAKLYTVTLSGATNILGSRWDDAATTPSLEALDDPATAGITVLPKTPVLDLSTLAGMPPKIEGVAVLDRSTIVVANDNDFDIGTFDEAGNHRGAGAKSQILIVSLAAPLP